jgi:hypothetical protein
MPQEPCLVYLIDGDVPAVMYTVDAREAVELGFYAWLPAAPIADPRNGQEWSAHKNARRKAEGRMHGHAGPTLEELANEPNNDMPPDP